ncbi:MAG: hypothetical protein K2Q01_11090 [Rickettsiales bacterium]|nr:hypothetical protein [Rickettsiales bacterium]
MRAPLFPVGAAPPVGEGVAVGGEKPPAPPGTPVPPALMPGFAGAKTRMGLGSLLVCLSPEFAPVALRTKLETSAPA